MRKKEFIRRYFDFLKEVGLSAAQVRVGAGGVLLMLDLREQTEDLDLELSPEVYSHLVATYKLKTVNFEKHPGTGQLAVWDDHIDLHAEDDLDEGIVIEGVWTTTPEKVLALKRTLNRPKDQNDIRQLERLIKKNPKYYQW